MTFKKEYFKEMTESSVENLKKQVAGKLSGTMEKAFLDEYKYGDKEALPRGLQVVLTHQLAPDYVKLTINNVSEENDNLFTTKYYKDYEPKYKFCYRYLDIDFDITTNNDDIAAQLYPFFTDEQKDQVMTFTLGSKNNKV